MERKNLKVPNFPTWEELESKQASGELESYVEEVKKMISEAKQSQTVENSDKNEEKVENEIVPPVNPVADSKDKDHNSETERERERERERDLRTQIQHLEQKPTKTPKQEAELVAKKQELAELEKKLRELEQGEKQELKEAKDGP